MRYICSICGYVYDEEKETIVFSVLPDSWVCPLCGAAKALFRPEREEIPVELDAAPIQADEDLLPLSAGVLAAICAKLARGSEKQYKAEEETQFRQLADYFAAAAPTVPDADTDRLISLFQADLDQSYPAAGIAAKAVGDRGTQRVCVWGEKVTRILHSLVKRYQEEGPAFLLDTKIWVCSVCGFVYVGDTPPELCPVCKVPAWKFDAF